MSEIREDLTANITKISDSLLTENLAEIFLQQGKSDKAIEIYKKLIWKFPQKKAYFASQIDKLSRR
ncbi:MAG TPA: tetratricopeptide repeat protein [Cyclobacteriaceae bacterium]|jgi:tetratricopeptide (TPR) repeat protein